MPDPIARGLLAVLMTLALVPVLGAGGALAWGPRSITVGEAVVVPLSLPSGGHVIAIPLESAVLDPVTWRVEPSVSTGWTVVASTEVAHVGSAADELRSAWLGLELTPIDPRCPPVGAVVDLRMSDPTGDHYTVRARLHYRVEPTGIVPINFEEYHHGYALIDAGHPREAWCQSQVVTALPDAGADESLDNSGGGVALLAVDREITGHVVFWDSRGNRSDAAGTRLPTCNPAVTSCAPNSAGCCWRGVPHAYVQVTRSGGWGPTTYTDANGVFSLLDAGAPSSATYTFRARLLRGEAHYPGPMRVLDSSGDPVQVLDAKVGSGGVLDFGTQAFNSAGDTTSARGDQVTLFVAGTEAFFALEAEGETRHRLLAPPSGEYHTFRHGWGSSFTDCDDRTVYIQSAYARELEAVHLLGFLYVGDVVGCSGNDLAYPKTWPGGYDRYTAEGNALRVGLASLLVTLSRFDPDVASTSDIFTSLYGCRGNAYANANLASDERNNWHALWELIDSDDGNTSGYDDLLDLTLPELMDGLLELRDNGGSPGTNLTSDEQILTEVPYSVCFSADHCDDYDACVGYICYTGDPHGENIWDLASNTCDSQSCGWGIFGFLSTVASSPCLGEWDDTYPFGGGFRLD